jgi:hypothetical protein
LTSFKARSKITPISHTEPKRHVSFEIPATAPVGLMKGKNESKKKKQKKAEGRQPSSLAAKPRIVNA